MRQRGQIAIGAVAGLTAALLGAVVLLHLARVSAGGAGAQTAADVAALAAARTLASDPTAGEEAVRAAAAAAAKANGARLTGLTIDRTGAVARAVEVGVAVGVAGTLPVVGRQDGTVTELARAGVGYTAALPGGTFRPVDLHGARGPLAAVAAAEAQVGWPYVWGGESRAEGGFDCSGLIDYAYGAAGLTLPGRPTAADLWRLAAPESPDELAPGDLVFAGAATGAPHHVGMYVGGGTVVAAPHTGAQVRYEPLAGGGWDGYGRLAAPAPSGPAAEPAVARAARRHQVPAHVLAAELELGLSSDVEAAAAALASAQLRHPGDLQAALADALDDPSLAAAVLSSGSGPGLAGTGGSVRLLPLPEPPAAPGWTSPMHTAPLTPAAGGEGGGHGLVRSVGELMASARHVARHLGETGTEVGFQGAAGLRTGARAGLLVFAAVLPEEWERDLSSAAGSTWDTASAIAEMSDGGMPLSAFGLWAARFTLMGTVIFAGWSLVAAFRAGRRDERIVAGMQAVGYALNAGGIATAGTGLITAGAATAEIPPVGLALCAAGSALLAGSYAYRDRASIARAAGRAAGAATSAARTSVHAALDAINPF